MPVANARPVSIPPMAWGSADPVPFLNHWANRIAVQDPSGFRNCGQAPRNHMATKLFHTPSAIKKPGNHGWTIWQAGPGNCVQGYVYCDGTPTQLTELGAPMSGLETWWPCIVIWEQDAPELAFYCPALAWQHVRPWGVHVSRLRRRKILPQTAPPVLPGLPTPHEDDSCDAQDSAVDWEIVEGSLPLAVSLLDIAAS